MMISPVAVTSARAPTTRAGRRRGRGIHRHQTGSRAGSSRAESAPCRSIRHADGAFVGYRRLRLPSRWHGRRRRRGLRGTHGGGARFRLGLARRHHRDRAERLQARRRRDRDHRAVVGGEALDLTLDPGAHGRVADPVQVHQGIERTEAITGDRAAQRVAQVTGQRPGHVAGDDDAALDVALHLGPLLGHLLHDAVVHVAVELVDGDVSVAVEVGGPLAEPFDEVPGEHRLRRAPVHPVALERVLRRVRRREHGPARALQLLERVDIGVGLDPAAGRERAAVAAVEHDDLLPRRAALQGVVELLGRQRGEQQAVPAGVGRCEVEPPVVVLEAVAGEVQQGEVVAAAVAVQLADRLAHPVVRFVDQHGDLEACDLRVTQYGGESLDVRRWGGEPAQGGVVVLVRGDQQRQPAAHGVSPRSGDGRTPRPAPGAPPPRPASARWCRRRPSA
jgi:hypothetical protein